MNVLSELLISALVIIGASFALIGSIAMVRLPDPLQRLHGPTKATTLGVGAILIASMVHQFAENGTLSFHELLITVFLIITAPISAHLIAKAYLRLTASRQ